MLGSPSETDSWSLAMEFCITGGAFLRPSGGLILALRLCATLSEPMTWQRREPSVTSLKKLTTNSGQLCCWRERPSPSDRDVQRPPSGFRRRSASAIGPLTNWRVEEIVQRVTAIMGNGMPAVVSTAVLGGEQVPKVRVSEAFDIYCNEIVA